MYRGGRRTLLVLEVKSTHSGSEKTLTFSRGLRIIHTLRDAVRKQLVTELGRR